MHILILQYSSVMLVLRAIHLSLDTLKSIMTPPQPLSLRASGLVWSGRVWSGLVGSVAGGAEGSE